MKNSGFGTLVLYLGIALAACVAFIAFQASRISDLKVALKLETANHKVTRTNYTSFVGEVDRRGREAKERATIQARLDAKKKEMTDAEIKKLSGALAVAASRLRNLTAAARDSVARSVLPAAEAGSHDPARIVFDRGELDLALREYLAGEGEATEAIARLVIEGEEKRLIIEELRKWAK